MLCIGFTRRGFGGSQCDGGGDEAGSVIASPDCLYEHGCEKCGGLKACVGTIYGKLVIRVVYCVILLSDIEPFALWLF